MIDETLTQIMRFVVPSIRQGNLRPVMMSVNTFRSLTDSAAGKCGCRSNLSISHGGCLGILPSSDLNSITYMPSVRLKIFETYHVAFLLLHSGKAASFVAHVDSQLTRFLQKETFEKECATRESDLTTDFVDKNGVHGWATE